MDKLEKRFKERKEMEAALNKISFNNIGIGGMLSFQLGQYIQRDLEPKGNLALLQSKYLLNFFSGKNFSFPKNRIWLSPTGSTERFTGLFLPILQFLPKDSFSVLLKIGNYQPINFPHTPKLTFSLWIKWLSSYLPIRKEVEKILHDKWPADLNARNAKRKLMVDLTIQTQLAVLYDEIIRQAKPKVILVDHDRQSVNSVLILVANKYNVLTQTLVHGSTYPIHNYVPVLAKQLLCWGPVQVNQFSEHGFDPASARVVGNSKFKAGINASKIDVRKKLGVGDDVKIAVWGNNRFAENKHFEVVKSFIDSFAATQGKWFPVIKLHPSDDKQQYENYLRDSSNYLLLGTDYNLDEVLAVADIMFFHSSNIAQDAMLKKVPVGVFNPTDVDAGIGEVLREQAGTPYIKTKNELTEFLMNFNDQRQLADLTERQSEFFNNYCRYIGDASAAKIAETFDEANRPVLAETA
jgi:hypothetical protein